MADRILWKLADTIRICATLFLARMFGRYEHSVWDGHRIAAAIRSLGKPTGGE